MIFVTGGSGLLGAHLITALAKQGKAVKALYRNSIPVFEGSDKVEWIQGDILDVIVLDEALINVEQVYHCAAIVSYNSADKDLMFKTNIDGTANIVNACINAGVKKLCYASSVSALGRPKNNAPVTEEMHWSEETGNSNYGKSKFLAEREVWRGIGEGLEAVIVNPVVILGSGDWNKSSAALFKSAYNEFPYYTDGATGFADVLDVVKAMMKLMQSEIINERFIICGANLAYKELFDEMAKGFGKKPPHKKATPFMSDLVWKLEAVKSFFTGKKPLLTRETAGSAQSVVRYNNSKLLNFFPDFSYTPIKQTIKRVCTEMEKKNH